MYARLCLLVIFSLLLDATTTNPEIRNSVGNCKRNVSTVIDLMVNGIYNHWTGTSGVQSSPYQFLHLFWVIVFRSSVTSFQYLLFLHSDNIWNRFSCSLPHLVLKSLLCKKRHSFGDSRVFVCTWNHEKDICFPHYWKNRKHCFFTLL